jgi:hypothetical protein
MNSEEIPIDTIKSHPFVKELMEVSSVVRDLEKEVKLPYVRKNLVLMSPGIWNGYMYTPEEIKIAFNLTDWNDPDSRALFLDHQDRSAADWIGEILNPRLDEASATFFGDIRIVSHKPTAMALEFGAHLGISPKVLGDVVGADNVIRNFTYKNFSIVKTPAVKTAYINSEEVKEESNIQHPVICLREFNLSDDEDDDDSDDEGEDYGPEEFKMFAAELGMWTTKYKNDLPDSAFFYIGPGGKKDSEDKTVPRSLRKCPYTDQNGKIDLPHLRNAISRLAQPATDIPESIKKELLDRARAILEKETKKDSTNSEVETMSEEKTPVADVVIPAAQEIAQEPVVAVQEPVTALVQEDKSTAQLADITSRIENVEKVLAELSKKIQEKCDADAVKNNEADQLKQLSEKVAELAQKIETAELAQKVETPTEPQAAQAVAVENAEIQTSEPVRLSRKSEPAAQVERELSADELDQRMMIAMLRKQGNENLIPGGR